ncbi:UV DNA damage repair endonuclease UvsE [Methanofollis fontis]|uniref:UV DNA damage repair endonuclease UvsE n=1 Tax=Methanofollis fontis TaxID=2052832 RepID=A0A483CNJ3_9EURY|nr:UV DNA damage repair endonuclease UvsE [Methanofollis fontis]TAJ44182.1 UV DNA damage repair endonuclease UvsE [Methanofollis fontis]
MRIGYPCVNRGIGCTSARTFRLKSWSEERFYATMRENLECLSRTLEFNRTHGLLFFRITSDLVPFASHPVNTLDWESAFAEDFSGIGRMLRENGMRISMHPDQFTLINSPDEGVLMRSIAELEYHSTVLDAMGLDSTAKVQIHVGGRYGDAESALGRFVDRYRDLPAPVRRRLVVENDDRLFTVTDCLLLHRECGTPVLFDAFHHECNPDGSDTADALGRCAATWGKSDGILMTDYSSQENGARKGTHAQSIDISLFSAFLTESRPHDIDIMLEIKDKEQSARRALEAARGDTRLVQG